VSDAATFRPAPRRADGTTQTLSTDARRAREPADRIAGPPSPHGAVPRDAIFRRLLALADITAAAAGIALSGLLAGHGTPSASLATIPLIVLIAKVVGRYDHDEVVLRKSTLDEAPALLTLAAAYAITWSLVTHIAGLDANFGASALITLTGVTAVLLIALRAAARAAGQHWAPGERVLIVGSASARARLAHCLASDPSARIEVAGFLPLEDERRVASDWGSRSRRRRQVAFDDLPSVVRDLSIDRVFLIATSEGSETMLDAVRRTTAVGVKLSIVPRLFEVVGSAVEFDTVGGVTVLGLRRPGLTRSSYAAKRTMDIVGAAFGLLICAPLAAVVALAIKLESPGPVFFRQLRVGRDGRTFTLIKFRSMVDGAEIQREALEDANESHGIFKLTSDPRVTRAGRFLRRTSIDELPQLVNVLRGDMSLVGPRPLVVPEDRLVEGRHRARLQLTPGMTGPWQVLGPSRPPLSEMVKTDYLYAVNWSLWTDVKIILRTFLHVAARRGL
jgi:exopolysaccharide biosynthesis polyprenyl glycosylphosphotransferase